MVAANPSMLQVALDHARRGWPVFPLAPGEKVPAFKSAHPEGDPLRNRCHGQCGQDGHGCYDATREERTLLRWWTGWAVANVGLATGATSGLLVLDVDGEKGEASLAALVARHGALPVTAEVRTRKGRHIYFLHVPGLKNRAAILSKDSGLDIRTDGGYVVAPGSVVGGHTYALADRPVAAAPSWLVALFPKKAEPKPRAAAAPRQAPKPADPHGFTRYGLKAFELELNRLRQAVEGTRNDTLNAVAFNLGQLQAGGEIPDVAENLVSEAVAIGLGDAESRKTVGSAYRAGMQKPRSAPPRGDAPRTQPGTATAVGLAEGAPVASHLRVLPRETAPAQRNLTGPEDRDQGAPADDAGPPPVDTRDAGGPDEPDRPEIHIGPELMVMNDAAQKALLTCSPITLYHHAQRLAEIRSASGNEHEWIQRLAGAPVIADVQPARLAEILSVSAKWLKWNERKKDWVHAKPANESVAGLLARAGYGFPPLGGIVTSPYLRPDGTACTTPGYDRATGVFFEPGTTTFLPCLEKPTRKDAEEAFHELREPFGDFPFKASEDLAATIAALLSLLARPAIAGPVPLFPVRANTPGTGKGLLVETVVRIASGREAPAFPAAHDDTEWSKRILSIVLAGLPVVLIDNVGEVLGSDALALALTSSNFSDRVLGESRSASAPMRTVWFSTGNNTKFVRDMGRRVVPIDLFTELEKPEARDGFKHRDLIGYVTAERPRLVRAGLTMLQAFCRAGRPTTGKPPLGSYPAWDDVVRACVLWVSGIDPCATRDRLAGDGDGDDAVIRSLYGMIREAVGASQTFDVHELVQAGLRTGNETLKGVLGSLCKDSTKLDARAIGRFLGKISGRTVGKMRLERSGLTHGGLAAYVLRETEQGTLGLRASGDSGESPNP